MPSFLVDIDGYDRLPKYSPGDLNVVSINDRLRELDRQHTAMKSSITINASATENIENKVDTIESAVLQHTNNLSHDTKNIKSVVTASKPPQDLQLYRNIQLFQCHNIPWMGNKKINCIHIEKTSKPDDMFQYFKIAVPADDYHESLDPESWPNGVYVRASECLWEDYED